MTREGTAQTFDHHDPSYGAHRHEIWQRLRKCPVDWSDSHGGFWVVSGYEEVAAVSRDSATFTSRYVEEGDDGMPLLGITGIPRLRGIPPALIAEVEGSHHANLRRVLNPFMLPSAVDANREFVRSCAHWFLDQVIEKGEMDMVKDFTGPIPAVLTMKMVGLPLESWSWYAEMFHAVSAHRPGTPAFDDAQKYLGSMMKQLLEIAEERRSTPQDDIISRLVEMQGDDGQPLRDADLIGILWNLIGGGLDTTTSLTSLALRHLSAHPDLRARLIEEPSLMASATEEYLRFTSVNETLTRTVTKDLEFAGASLHRGDFLMLSWLSANFDETVFENPDEVILDRSPNPHLAFGIGPHRCIGMHVARSLFSLMVTEILNRIPDFSVDEARTKLYRGNPQLAGVVTMPVTFSVGPSLGTARPF